MSSHDAELIARLRRLAASGGRNAEELEQCDLCGAEIAADHRHLLHLEERRILCACEPCVAMRSGDGPYRPTGSRLLWLHGFDLTEDLWARLRIPIGLAFFLRSSSVGGVVGLYPSPAGATESELDLGAWEELSAANPVLATLDEDVEGLIVNRISDPHQFAIAPIDECYALVGAVKANWEGISGGGAVERVVPSFLEQLRERAVPA
ncbi:MAG TPA: DUF5947 family protein [Solirubrobacterales bacterium]|jgi:hypothetical protein